ncbi:MAG: phosphatase PAP2 family protein [Gemmatimonadetes bacterium]|nr:phosphatase PAP2 family protein [Gemmatimonadota bacterium]MBI2403708.1 phosphatase PAP2 family protein [Gemmatimonadota bacterium]
MHLGDLGTHVGHRSERSSLIIRIRVWGILATLLAPPQVTLAQSADAPLKPADGAVILAGAILFAAPHVLGINDEPPACAPCNRAAVPWFDRWAIAEPRALWETLSTTAVLGIGLFAAWDLAAHRAPDPAAAHVAVLAQSAALALGAVEVTKALVGRNRPVLYTGAAVEAARSLDSRRSWPSGHTATATALVTSYLLSVNAPEATEPAWQPGVLLLASAGVGAMRVAAARHFPSDVASGAVFGVLSALAVHLLRF